MIKKNSGGEGQNPLYVALLASFAQAYRIDLSSRDWNGIPTIRLVVLDEAFSKMDAEKVASCIELIRGLGLPGHHQRHQRQDPELSGKRGQDLRICKPE